jgi:hypothetical protein
VCSLSKWRFKWPGRLQRLSKRRWAWKSTCTPAQRASKPQWGDLPRFKIFAFELRQAPEGRPICKRKRFSDFSKKLSTAFFMLRDRDGSVCPGRAAWRRCVLRRRLHGRVRLTNHDRWFFIQLYRWFPSILQALTIIRPRRSFAGIGPAFGATGVGNRVDGEGGHKSRRSCAR